MTWGIVAAAAITVVGGVIQSSNAASAAKDQANAQKQGQDAAIAEQQRQFDLVQSMYAPQRALGNQSMGILSTMFGGNNTGPGSVNDLTKGGGSGGPGGKGGAPATPGGGPDYSNFYNSPGYQFSLKAGESAINRASTARGDLYTPNTMNALGEYAQGRASSQYNSYVNQLLQAAGLGSAATAGTSGAALSTGENISQGMTNIGAANASGILGSSGAWNKAIGSATTAVGGATGALIKNYNQPDQTAYDPYAPNPSTDTGSGGYSDIRLKQNIVRIGATDAGVPLYRFEYKADPGREHIGVMAHEARVKFPEAVTERAGFLYVDYARIG